MTVAKEFDVRVLATDWLPLDRAALCLDVECETIYPLSAPACPRCGSTARMALASWLHKHPRKLECACPTLGA